MRIGSSARALILCTLIFGCADSTNPNDLLQTSPIIAVVNGKPWRLSPPHGDTLGDVANAARFLEFGGVDSTGPKLTTVAIMIPNVLDTGFYVLGNPSAPASGTYAILTLPPDLHTTAYETDGSHGGIVHLAVFDTTAQFVQGTFAFTAMSVEDTTQVVTVTQGRFRGHFFRYY